MRLTVRRIFYEKNLPARELLFLENEAGGVAAVTAVLPARREEETPC